MTDTPQTTASNIFMEQPKRPSSKIPSITTFAVGILLFFLPFAEVKCNNATLVDNSGFGIAIGSEWRTSANSIFGNDMFGDRNSTTTSTTKKKQEPNVFAIAALAFGVIALLLSITSSRVGVMGAAITGILAAGALIGLFVDLKRKVKGSLGDMDQGMSNGFGGDMKISLAFTPWFYAAVLAFIIGAIFCFRRKS